MRWDETGEEKRKEKMELVDRNVREKREGTPVMYRLIRLDWEGEEDRKAGRERRSVGREEQGE